MTLGNFYGNQGQDLSHQDLIVGVLSHRADEFTLSTECSQY